MKATAAALVRNARLASFPVVAALALAISGSAAWAKDKDKEKEVVPFEESRIFIEYNSTDNDLGFHVKVDQEAWKTLKITNPKGRAILDTQGRSAFRNLGMSEFFVEGAEPTLDEFPLADLLALFPEGTYRFEGRTVDGVRIKGASVLTHAVPAGPDVSASDQTVGPGNSLHIRWDPVTEHATDPAGGVFPDEAIEVVAYEIIVAESFDVTVPAADTPMSVTVSPEVVESLEAGEHGFEVLAIEKGGNQTITAGSFTK